MSNRKWVVEIGAEDGTHFHVYGSVEGAARAYADQLGRDLRPEVLATLKDGVPVRAVGDDWGRRISVYPAPGALTTAKQMAALRRAYDARECGVATKAQLALLAKAGE